MTDPSVREAPMTGSTEPPTAAADTRSSPATGLSPASGPAPSSGRLRGRGGTSSFGRTAGGVAAIGVKELRGRMRGRRAFIILTLYLVLLAGFALMAETIIERGFTSNFGGASATASASIGQGIFAALLMLETLQVVFLSPSSTAGAISLEREKQTLELLVVTPITSLAIIVGKLLSTLVYVFLLIAASLPLMAVVFVYGGVGPEDVLRGYIVLIAAAVGLGSFGLLCSSLVKRTTAATAITIFGVLAMTVGTFFVLAFWTAMGSFDNNGNRVGGLFGMRAPAVLAYVNPFIAQADVMCGTETGLGAWCSAVSAVAPNDNGIVFTGQDVQVSVPEGGNGGAFEKGVAIDDVAPQPFGVQRDTLWPKSVLTWAILSIVFIVLSIQAVSPTRRWRLRRERGPSGRQPGPPGHQSEPPKVLTS
ncbi:MAG: ABC transporter permease subunit [Candidatus Limnocylindrales bacterium]